jgi:predicted DNA-binding transcriptional regulator AlpA
MDGILIGMKAICNYTQKSNRTILFLIEKQKFPATKIGGQWTSSAALIDAWVVSLIKKRSDAR